MNFSQIKASPKINEPQTLPCILCEGRLPPFQCFLGLQTRQFFLKPLYFASRTCSNSV